MGLTIHYTLTPKLEKPKEVRRLVETIRELALDLPFKEVSEIKEFKGSAADHNDSLLEMNGELVFCR